MKLWLAAITVAASLALPGAQAQTATSAIWRCGPEGRDYSDQPCPGGQTLALADERSAAQTQAARALAARERRLADSLAREREQRERPPQAPPAAAPRAAKAAAKPHAPPRGVKRRAPEDEGIWRAIAPASRRAKG